MNSDPYKETVELSPNQSGKRSPRFIILHHSAGSFEGTVSWIKNSKSKVSYHYVIDPETGDRVQMVWDSKTAWHAGRSSYGGFTGLNKHSVGIAFAGDTYKREVASHEIDSCARKCIYLMNKFGISIHGILTHQEIAPGRKNDCSPETKEQVLERVKELLDE